MMANLNGLWDWVGMAPCMGPLSPVCAYSLWAGLFPEKLVKLKKKKLKSLVFLCRESNDSARTLLAQLALWTIIGFKRYINKIIIIIY